MKQKIINRYFDSYEEYKAFEPFIKIGEALLIVNILVGILF